MALEVNNLGQRAAGITHVRPPMPGVSREVLAAYAPNLPWRLWSRGWEGRLRPGSALEPYYLPGEQPQVVVIEHNDDFGTQLKVALVAGLVLGLVFSGGK